jgi:hypothetical protein
MLLFVLGLGCCHALGVGEARLIVGLKQPAAGSRRMEELFWKVADQKEEQINVRDITRLVGATNATINRAREWAKNLGATGFKLTPTRDAAWVAVPAGTFPGRKAPTIPPSLASDIDFILLETSAVGVASNTTSTRQRHARGSSMGLSAQKKAYGVPSDLIGSSKGNLQVSPTYHICHAHHAHRTNG